MNGVKDSMLQLSDSIEAIAQALSGINDTIGESQSVFRILRKKTSSMAEKDGNDA